jgi:hypothetical protein
MQEKQQEGDEFVARSAFLSATTAAAALATGREEALARGNLTSGALTCYVPLVVISGRLCEAMARDDGQLEVTEVDESVWLAPPDAPGAPGMLVTVVTAAAWPRVVHELALEAREFARLSFPAFKAARMEVIIAGKRERVKAPPSVSYPFGG